MPNNWSSFTKSITIKSSREKLYHAFASREGMESWFLRRCDYSNEKGMLLDAAQHAKEGNSYYWLWWGWPDETNEKGLVLQANEKDVFEFTFSGTGKNDMRVKVSLLQQPGTDEWRVDLHQYNIPEDDDAKAFFFVGCGEGWTFYLANLKSIMEGGIDLRNKNIAITKVINS